jgi:hypothetical protein
MTRSLLHSLTASYALVLSTIINVVCTVDLDLLVLYRSASVKISDEASADVSSGSALCLLGGTKTIYQ